ncbi:MAG: transglutaminase family protein [Pseudomonadota bacterium]|nr:transglutaminase family protein [Pseudomonadota bacterium]
MKIRIGYDIRYECPQPTFMILMLNVHYSRVGDLLGADHVMTSPSLPMTGYRDIYGNWCTRILAPAGETRIWADAVIRDSGEADVVALHARQTPVEELPDEALLYLLASRYCETDRLMDMAWSLFGSTAPGWQRVQAICEYVHERVTFGYAYARSSKTAHDAHEERQGVCRDFAHLALTLCRCMNIPARYCTGYMGDIGVPISDSPMDFSGWFEAYLDGRWYTFDARHKHPRIGRILIARGRDAADVAITTTFGANTLKQFTVISDELPED